MADIISSLFGLTPIQENIEAKQRERQYGLGQLYGQATVNVNAPLAKQQAYIGKQGAQAALGGMAVRGLGSLFGLKDPMLKRVTGLESILQSTQMDLGEEANNPTVFYPELQKRLAEGGFTREALQVGQVAQKAIQEYGLTQAQRQAQLATAKEKMSTSQLRDLEVQQRILEFGSVPAKAEVLRMRMPELSEEQALALAGDPALIREVLKDSPDATQVVETQRGQILINKRTGQEIANLGAAPDRSTRVNVNVAQTAETEYAKKVGTAIAEKDVAEIDKAQSVATTLPKMYETRQLLETGDLTTGIGAEAFLVLQRARSKFLEDKKAGKNVTDTEYLNALLGSDVFPQISALGIGARGLDTPAEREFLREVMTGTISLNKDTLKRLTDLRIKTAEEAVSRYNKRLETGEFEQYQRITGRGLAPVKVPKPSPAPTGKVNQTSSGTVYKIIEK